MKTVHIILIGYLSVMNIIGFTIMGIDKKKAEKKKWRIRESTLFLVSLIGGSLGTLSGMYAFRHKTRKTGFVIGMPFILILHIAITVFLFYKGIL